MPKRMFDPSQQQQGGGGMNFTSNMAGGGGMSPGGSIFGPGGQRGVQGNKFSPESAYAESIPQQAGDYDSIMGQYQSLLDRGSSPYNDVTSRYQRELDRMKPPGEIKYEDSPEWGDTYGKIRDLVDTGGLSDKDQQNLRARATSPVRAVYANAKRNMDRQRSLSGGGGANFAAASAKMAREQSAQAADSLVNANAGIAEMVQKGKLSSAPTLEKMVSGKNDLMNQMKVDNARIQGDYSGNMGRLLEGYSNVKTQENRTPLEALQGMTSLYAARPGLVSTFGDQVGRTQDRNAQMQQSANDNATRRYGFAMGGGGRGF